MNQHFKELFIAVLIVALFFAVFDGQRQRKHLTEFVKTETVLKARLDSITDLQHKADLSAIEWHTKYNVLEAGTKRQGDQLINVIKQNAYLKKTYAPLLPDSVLQREVATLYKGR